MTEPRLQTQAPVRTTGIQLPAQQPVQAARRYKWSVPHSDVDDRAISTSTFYGKWPADLEALQRDLDKIQFDESTTNADEIYRLYEEVFDKHWPPELKDWTEEQKSFWLREHFNIVFNYDEDERERLRRLLRETPHPPEEPSHVAMLPPVPPEAEFPEYPYMLGWPVDTEWLVLFWEVSQEVRGIPLPHRKATSKDMDQGKFLLALHHHMGWEAVRRNAAGVWPDGPRWSDYLIIARYDYLPIAELIHIAGTSNPISYYNRPTEAQYQWLKKIMGPREPIWFRHYYSTESCKKYDYLFSGM